jgi:hypothetical protein
MLQKSSERKVSQFPNFEQVTTRYTSTAEILRHHGNTQTENGASNKRVCKVLTGLYVAQAISEHINNLVNLITCQR